MTTEANTFSLLSKYLKDIGSSPLTLGSEDETKNILGVRSKLRLRLCERISLTVLASIVHVAKSNCDEKATSLVDFFQHVNEGLAGHNEEQFRIANNVPMVWKSYVIEGLTMRMKNGYTMSQHEDISEVAPTFTDFKVCSKMLLNTIRSTCPSSEEQSEISNLDFTVNNERLNFSCDEGILLIQLLSHLDPQLAVAIASISLLLPQPTSIIRLLTVWLRSWLTLPLLSHHFVAGDDNVLQILSLFYDALNILSHEKEGTNLAYNDSQCYPLYLAAAILIQERDRVLSLATSILKIRECTSQESDLEQWKFSQILSSSIYDLAEVNAKCEKQQELKESDPIPEIKEEEKEITFEINAKSILKVFNEIPSLALGVTRHNRSSALAELLLHRAMLLKTQTPPSFRKHISELYRRDHESVCGDIEDVDGSAVKGTLQSLLNVFPSIPFSLDAVVEVVASSPNQSLTGVLPFGLQKELNLIRKASANCAPFWAYSESLPTNWRLSDDVSSQDRKEFMSSSWATWTESMTKFVAESLDSVEKDLSTSEKVAAFVGDYNRRMTENAKELTRDSSDLSSETGCKSSIFHLSPIFYLVFSIKLSDEPEKNSLMGLSGYSCPYLVPATVSDSKVFQRNNGSKCAIEKIINSSLFDWIMPPFFTENAQLKDALAREDLTMETITKLVTSVFPNACLTALSLSHTIANDVPTFTVESSVAFEAIENKTMENTIKILRPLLPLASIVFIDTRPLSQFLTSRLPASVHLDVTQFKSAILALHKALVFNWKCTSSFPLAPLFGSAEIFPTLTKLLLQNVKQKGSKLFDEYLLPPFFISHLCFLGTLQLLVRSFAGAHICIIYEKDAEREKDEEIIDTQTLDSWSLLDTLPLLSLFQLMTTGKPSVLPKDFIKKLQKANKTNPQDNEIPSHIDVTSDGQEVQQNQQSSELSSPPQWMQRGMGCAHALAAWVTMASRMDEGINALSLRGSRVHVSAVPFSTIVSELPTPSLLVSGAPAPILKAREDARQLQLQRQRETTGVRGALLRLTQSIDAPLKAPPPINTDPKVTGQARAKTISIANEISICIGNAIEQMRTTQQDESSVDNIKFRKETILKVSQGLEGLLKSVPLDHTSESLSVYSTLVAASIGQKLRKLLLTTEIHLIEPQPKVNQELAVHTKADEGDEKPNSEQSSTSASLVHRFREKARQLKQKLVKNIDSKDDAEKESSTVSQTEVVDSAMKSVSHIEIHKSIVDKVKSDPPATIQGSLTFFEKHEAEEQQSSPQKVTFGSGDSEDETNIEWCVTMLSAALSGQIKNQLPSRMQEPAALTYRKQHLDLSLSLTSVERDLKDISCKLELNSCSIPCVVRSRRQKGTGRVITRIYDMLVGVVEDSEGKSIVKLKWVQLPTNASGLSDYRARLRIEPLRSLSISDIERLTEEGQDEGNDSMSSPYGNLAVRIKKLTSGSFADSATKTVRIASQWLQDKTIEKNEKVAFVLPSSVFRVLPATSQESKLHEMNSGKPSSSAVLDKFSLDDQSNEYLSDTVEGPVFVVGDDDDDENLNPNLSSVSNIIENASSAKSESHYSGGIEEYGDGGDDEDDDNDIGHFRYGGDDSDSDGAEDSADKSDGDSKSPWSSPWKGDKQNLSNETVDAEDHVEDVSEYREYEYADEDYDDLYAQHFIVERGNAVSSVAADELAGERAAELESELSSHFALGTSSGKDASHRESSEKGTPKAFNEKNEIQRVVNHSTQNLQQEFPNYDETHSSQEWAEGFFLPSDDLIVPDVVSLDPLLLEEAQKEHDHLYFEAIAEFKVLCIPGDISSLFEEEVLSSLTFSGTNQIDNLLQEENKQLDFSSPNEAGNSETSPSEGELQKVSQEEKKSGLAKLKESVSKAVSNVKESVAAVQEERARKRAEENRRRQMQEEEEKAYLLLKKALYVNLRLWLQDPELTVFSAIRVARAKPQQIAAGATSSAESSQTPQQASKSSSFVSSFKSLFSKKEDKPQPPPPIVQRASPPSLPIAAVLSREAGEIIVLRPARGDVARILTSASTSASPDTIFAEAAIEASQKSEPVLERISPEVDASPSQWPCEIADRFRLENLGRITSAASDPGAIGIYWKQSENGMTEPEPLLLKFGSSELSMSFVARLKETFLEFRRREEQRKKNESENENAQKALAVHDSADLP